MTHFKAQLNIHLYYSNFCGQVSQSQQISHMQWVGSKRDVKHGAEKYFWEGTTGVTISPDHKKSPEGCILAKDAETVMLRKPLLYFVEKEAEARYRKNRWWLPFKNCSINASPPFMCSIAISSIASPGKAEEEIAASPLF